MPRFMPLLAASEPPRAVLNTDNGSCTHRGILNCKGEALIGKAKLWHASALQRHVSRRNGALLGLVYADSPTNACRAGAIYPASGARSFLNHFTPWLWSRIHRSSSGVSLDG